MADVENTSAAKQSSVLSDIFVFNGDIGARIKAEEFRADDLEGLLEGVGGSGNLNFAALQGGLAQYSHPFDDAHSLRFTEGLLDAGNYAVASRAVKENVQGNAVEPTENNASEHKSFFDQDANSIKSTGGEQAVGSDSISSSFLSVAPVSTAVVAGDNAARSVGEADPGSQSDTANGQDDKQNASPDGEAVTKAPIGEHGLPPKHGNAGADGTDGADGADGADGTDGTGANGNCEGHADDDCTLGDVVESIVNCVEEIGGGVVCVATDLIDEKLAVGSELVDGVVITAEGIGDDLTATLGEAVGGLVDNTSGAIAGAKESISDVTGTLCDFGDIAAGCINDLTADGGAVDLAQSFVVDAKGGIFDIANGIVEQIPSSQFDDGGSLENLVLNDAPLVEADLQIALGGEAPVGDTAADGEGSLVDVDGVAGLGTSGGDPVGLGVTVGDSLDGAADGDGIVDVDVGLDVVSPDSTAETGDSSIDLDTDISNGIDLGNVGVDVSVGVTSENADDFSALDDALAPINDAVDSAVDQIGQAVSANSGDGVTHSEGTASDLIADILSDGSESGADSSDTGDTSLPDPIVDAGDTGGIFDDDFGGAEDLAAGLFG